MRKILVSMYLLVFGLCLVGCQTIVEYASLSSITKDEDFTSAYLSSVNGDAQVLPVDFDDLKEKEFYKNIMNSSAKPTDVLPEVVPSYSLIICSDKNSLQVDDLGNLYATYKEKWYLIQCSKDDFNSLKDYLFLNNEETYKLTIKNETDYELIGIKSEYKDGEEVEVKMFYEDCVLTMVFLDGEFLGELNGHNSIKFNMPAKDSTLMISYSDELITVIHPENNSLYSF
ncbi:MAG: hypothetical protein IJ966_06550 [Bacilli bacterium]|nr:hypothetical protein [Bacilli bacterium]